MKFTAQVILLFLAVESREVFAIEYKPEPIEIFTTAQTAPDKDLWDKGCPIFSRKLVARTGPWAFGFFSEAKCIPVDQPPGPYTRWILKIETRGNETVFEITERAPGKNPQVVATISLPLHPKNIEWLQDQNLTDGIALALIDQLPALLYIGRYQPDLLVPGTAILPASKDLVWGTLDYDERQKTFSSNNLLPVKVDSTGSMTKFFPDGGRPKKDNGNLWIFNQRGPKARSSEIAAAIKQTHEKLSRTEVQDESEDPWHKLLMLRFGVSLANSPVAIKNSKMMELSFDSRSGFLKGLQLNYRKIPKSNAEDAGFSTYYSMESEQIGYRAAWEIKKGILRGISIIPHLGLWSISTSFPVETSLVEFSAKREIDLGINFAAELDLTPSFRIQGLIGKDFSGSIFGSSARSGLDLLHYGVDGYFLTGPDFPHDMTLFVNGFAFVEKFTMTDNSKGPDERSGVKLFTGYAGLGVGLKW